MNTTNDELRTITVEGFATIMAVVEHLQGEVAYLKTMLIQVAEINGSQIIRHEPFEKEMVKAKREASDRIDYWADHFDNFGSIDKPEA